jgi:serine/threonine protein kinase
MRATQTPTKPQRANDEYLEIGQTFGSYRIKRLIGKGGMGAVYEAVHLGLKKRVAIKTLLPARAGTANARARFLREGETASRISHPNVVTVFDMGMRDGISYLVMELLEGETLGRLMARKQRLPIEEALDLVLPVISAIAAGHDSGVIHRDLKPDNIFLARGPSVGTIPKVLDFGVARLDDLEAAPLTGERTLLGTAAYMAPEQVRGAQWATAASDQFAIGLILEEAVAGRRHGLATNPPVPSPDRQAMDVEGDSVGPDLGPILRRALAFAPEDRFPSMRALGRALLPLASDRTRTALVDVFQDDARRAQTSSSPASMEGVADGEGASLADGTEGMEPHFASESETHVEDVSQLRPSPPSSPSARRALWRVGLVLVPTLLVGLTVRAGFRGGARDRPASVDPSPRSGSPVMETRSAATEPSSPVPPTAPAASHGPVAPPEDAASPSGPPPRRRPGPQAERAATRDDPSGRAPRSREDAEALLAEAQAQLGDGRVEAACALGQTAARRAPRNASVWLFLGQCYLRLGQPDLARSYYRKYLAIVPSGPNDQFVRAIVGREVP